MKKIIPLVMVLLIAIFPVFSQSASASDFLAQGLQAYKDGNWNSAISLLKKANSLEETKSADVLYMLIMAQMFKGEYKNVITDSLTFEKEYPYSEYKKYVVYQKGRAYYYLGEYKTAIDIFAKFCSENESDEMFPSSLFWMGECLYQTYHFEEAKGVFQRVVDFYPNSAKYTEAVYRLDIITHREKEEKLLYLLKVTGEEFLSSKADYERELRKYQTDDNIDLRAKLDAMQKEKDALQNKLSLERAENEKLKNQISVLTSQNESLNKDLSDAAKINEEKQNAANLDQIEKLKQKAQKVQTIIDEEKY